MRLRLPRWAAVTAVLAVLAGAGTWTAVASDDPPPVHRADRMLDLDGTRLDTSYFTGDGDGRRPAVLLGHGFGGSKDDVRAQAEQLARDGYAVLTWSARGFGASGGEIGLNDPDHEVKDARKLIDWLAARPEVLLDKPGDPRVGVTGASYGGALSLLAAGHDPRVDAIAPQITYWNLADALFPEGVFKKLWAGIFFSAGNQPGAATPAGKTAACGRFTPELCALYERVAVNGKPDAAARALLEARSPAAVGARIKVPALLVQGQSDSLFTLAQSDAMARTLTANGAPVAVDWISGGHDGGDRETERVERRISSWFDRWLKKDTSADTGPAFRVSRTGGVDSTDGQATLRAATADRYPGLTAGPTSIPLAGAAQTFANPAGAAPPAVSAVPGLGGGVAGLSSLGVGLSLDFPGQHARFDAKPQDEPLRITGTPTVRVKVGSTASDGSAVLFAKLYDVGPDGRQQVLPAQLVAPVRVDGATKGGAAAGKSVTLTLPAIDHEVEAGHRLRLVVAATDLGYASPTVPADYTVAVESPLTVPTAPGLDPIGDLYAWFSGAATLGIVLLMAATSLAIIGFFRRADERQSVWRTVVAPAVAFLGLACVVCLMVANFPLLVGTPTGAWVIGGLVALSAVAGAVQALVLRARRPAVYERL